MRIANKSPLLFSALMFCLAATSMAELTTNIPKLEIIDTVNGTSIRDAIVTIGRRVLAPDQDGGYIIPQDTTSIMVRAPGYKAATFSVANAVQHKGKLPLIPITVKALYLTEYGIASKSLRDPVFEIIRHGNANALVINIKSDRGLIPYPSQIPLATAIGARKLTTIRSLQDLVKTGHDEGIYMIARIVTFKDDPLATSKPNLAVHTASGALFKDREHLSWTDPFQEEVRAYNIAVAVEAAKAGFDEVQFDYVRFPDCATKLVLSCPVDETSRVKALSTFLNEARDALAPYNVFESVDIFGYVSWNTNDTGIGQQLEDITKIVDYVCPMLYPSGFKYGIPGHRNPLATDADIYDTIKLTLDESLRRTKANPKKFRPWLQAFRDYAFNRREFGANEVATQIRATTDAGASGWSLWNARNQYGGTGLAPTKNPRGNPAGAEPTAASKSDRTH